MSLQASSPLRLQPLSLASFFSVTMLQTFILWEGKYLCSQERDLVGDYERAGGDRVPVLILRGQYLLQESPEGA